MSETIHDLTMLYLKNLNTSAFTPEQLYDEYQRTYETIKKYHYSKKSSSVSVLK